MSLSVPPSAFVATMTAEQLTHLVHKAMSGAQQRDPGESIWTSQQVADRFKLHVKTIARLVRQEGLPAHRVGGEAHGVYRFRRSEVEAWFASRRAIGGR